LGIPFYVVDAQEVFRQTVVETFMRGYAAGETPNPCLVCNRHIRWEFLLRRAQALGAQKMATGHYVRLDQNEEGQFRVRKAVDEAKDQSYVLHVLDQAQLQHALFPLGDYTKPDIRRMAAEFGLPVAERPDSQDLCFLGSNDYRAFLRRNLPSVESPGPIISADGQVLGEHRGLAFYTIGQRKGLGIQSQQPMFVLAKDVQHNQLVVGAQAELGQSRLVAASANWITGRSPDEPFRAEVKIRYKATPAPGLVSPLDNERFQVDFDQPLRDITLGQAAVVYSGDVCLGGGIIRS
jgi:tRNA-specific 2-thiouridylase